MPAEMTGRLPPGFKVQPLARASRCESCDAPCGAGVPIPESEGILCAACACIRPDLLVKAEQDRAAREAEPRLLGKDLRGEAGRRSKNKASPCKQERGQEPAVPPY